MELLTFIVFSNTSWIWYRYSCMIMIKVSGLLRLNFVWFLLYKNTVHPNFARTLQDSCWTSLIVSIGNVNSKSAVPVMYNRPKAFNLFYIHNYTHTEI